MDVYTTRLYLVGVNTRNTYWQSAAGGDDGAAGSDVGRRPYQSIRRWYCYSWPAGVVAAATGVGWPRDACHRFGPDSDCARYSGSRATADSGYDSANRTNSNTVSRL